ncbi:hypothetical protein A7D35_02830 [Xanthomonas arboricola]|uniref:hypothetical protein n=1 Tax=Xanthomonas arboricola TaxID=56448 RepID=UPI0007ECC04D|nr:hypothetical protein [Xanthomonas arboricola]OBR78765.1 hypothetical protein A7D35_02830 [Xanthomonas arboricola]
MSIHAPAAAALQCADFATGHRGQLLCLQVTPDSAQFGRGHVWAGLYASEYSRTAQEVSVGFARQLVARPTELQVGAGRYRMSTTALRAVVRWLDLAGRRVRQVQP